MMNVRPVLRVLWVWCLIGAALPESLRAEVSQSPPAPYAESLKPLLIPLEEVVKTKDPHAGKDEVGAMRLSETVTRVNEDGTYLRAVHSIVQPYTQKGAEYGATRRFRFQSHQETIHLALARTVFPDGTEKVLAPNAAFIQKGEQGADSIYDDGQELVLVFPDVKPGVLCEAIVVYERKLPAVTGGYSEFADWSAGWPIGVKRRVVDLPASWEKRMKVETIGKRGAPMTTLSAPEGRLRRAWQRENIASFRDEPNAAPDMQAGPGTWLTTFGNWDEVAAWYSGLLAERGDLGDELRAKVDEWTKDAKTPREVLTALFDHVANDVRYEGLEFGLSGLQPYPCATVWKNQYGDCKDKANLLVAMLRHKGIAGKVVLISTEHAGLVPKSVPDYQHFNHAIAIVDLPDGKGGVERVFCDGTIAHGKPGMLAPSSADREALAIAGDKAEWVKTPAVEAGTDLYTFDLEMNPDGGLSGWMTLKSTGFYGIQLAASFSGVDRDTAESRLRSYVIGFIAGAEVVDFVVPEERREVDETVVKVFFTSPARQPDSEGRMSLPFPTSKGLFPGFGDGKDRQTAYYMWRDHIRVVSKIRLPKGWSPESLPAPLTLETAPYQLSGQWAHADGICEATLDVKCLQSYLPADQVAGPAQANRAMSSWLEVPLRLKRGKDAAAAAPRTEVAMPLMPTGKGQVNLVNRWYPKGSDPAKRRAALEQVVRFFPDDVQAGYLVKLELSYEFFSAEKYQEAYDAFTALAKNKPEGVESEYGGYARYFEGLSLQELKRDDEALPVFREVAADEAVSDYRRGWAATMAGLILQKKAPVPADAVTLLKQASELNEEARELAVVSLIPAMVASGQGEALVKELGDGSLLYGAEDGGKAILQSLVTSYRSGETRSLPLLELLPWLRKAREAAGDSERGKVLAKACEDLLSWSAKGETYAAIRKDVVALLERELPDVLKESAIQKFSTAESAEKHLNEIRSQDVKAWMKLSACYFQKFEPTDSFSTILWNYINQTRTNESEWVQTDDRTLFAKLIEIAERLPRDDDNYWECLFTKATWFRDREKLDEAVALYQSLPGSPGFPEAYAHSASHYLGDVYEAQGRFRQAAECFVKFREERRDHRKVVEYLLRAGLCLARVGDEEEALKTWALLKDVPESVYQKSPYLGEIEEAVLLASKPEETLEQWKRTKVWWKDSFTPYFQSLGVGPIGRPGFFLSDQAEGLNLRCRKAVAGKDLKAVMQELAPVAITSRWLPVHSRSARQLVQIYVAPLDTAHSRVMSECFALAAGTTKVGRPEVLEENLRYDAATHFDLGKPERTLLLLEGQYDEVPGRTADHRERCAWLFGLAAGTLGQKVDVALKATTPWVEGKPVALSIGQWAPVHADLLVRAGREADAVTFLQTQADQVKGKADLETPILEKLAALREGGDGSGDIAAAAERFLKKNRPAWYDLVGPLDLKEPRIGDSEKVLEGDLKRFHEVEQFRLRMLLALSPEVGVKVRERAFGEAVLDAGKWCANWDQAVEVWSQVLDDKEVPLTIRLEVMWQGAEILAQNGQVRTLAKLQKRPLLSRYSSAYQQSYYPTLEKIAAGIEQGPDVLRKVIASMGGRELTSVDLTLAGMCYTGILTAGDLEGAASAREALKGWKIQPAAQSQRQQMRLIWIRSAGQAKSFNTLDRRLMVLYGDQLKALAGKAPSGWQQRIDLSAMYDLPPADRDAVRAAMAIGGFRHDRSFPGTWMGRPGFWLKNGGLVDRTKVVKLLSEQEPFSDEFHSALFLHNVLTSLEMTPDESWADVQAAAKGYLDRCKSPMSEVVFRIWTSPAFQKGGKLEVTEALQNAKQQGPVRLMMLGGALESAIVDGDRRRMEEVLAVGTPEEWTNAYQLTVYLPALQALKREEELELAIEDAERKIQETVMTAWLGHSPDSFQSACNLALLCDRKELLPGVWLDELPKTFSTEIDRNLALARVAEVKGDWKAMKAAVGRIQNPPAEYEISCRWLRGIALAGAGDPKGARAEMEAILKLGQHGNERFLDATEWLKKSGKEVK